MTILCFGSVTDITKSQLLKVPKLLNTSSLRDWLNKNYPDLKSLSYKVAVNCRVVDENVNIPPDAEIALLPPYSGG